jgi:hypothetical protein
MRRISCRHLSDIPLVSGMRRFQGITNTPTIASAYNHLCISIGSIYFEWSSI